MNVVDKWQTRADSLARAMRVGRSLVDEGKGNVYQIGNTFFEAAFGRYLAQPDGDEWRATLDEALELYGVALDRDDCRRWPEYPYNQAYLHLEIYLGHWWAEREAEGDHLDRAINLTIDALFDDGHHPLGSYAVLPPLYLLRRDAEHLAAFWKLIAEQASPEEFPPELAMWKRLSDAFLEGQPTAEAFWRAYDAYTKRVKAPTDQPARFYLALAKIGRDVFSVDEEPPAILRRLAVAPWQGK